MAIPFSSSEISQALSCMSEASLAVLEIYYDHQKDKDVHLSFKTDRSPLTKADLVANEILVKGLHQIKPSLAIVSEEMDVGNIHHECFWLVDPLDGTKEFVEKKDSFTLNVALIEDGVPTLGFVFAPALQEFYWGGLNFGSYYKKNGGFESLPNATLKSLPAHPKIAVSRLHAKDEATEYLKLYRDYELVEVGSSIKFCHVARGLIDLYPRFGPTHEWDTAAGQAILTSVGGFVFTDGGADLTYGKADYLNPKFIASRCAYHLLPV